MNEELLNLEPKVIWKYFRELTLIPRPSKKEGHVREFMMTFGKNLGLETLSDDTGNVIIRKPATPGMENRKGVILQGHLDMVPQKNNDVTHDFEKDPINAYIDGEWVTARGTTLGSDNGMGLSAIMSILESEDIPHGPIEALFTIDEETGMTGAFGIKPGQLKGEILLNLDSEDEGELYIGCAGGTNANMEFTCKQMEVPPDHVAYKLTVGGLRGGHSGLDINLGRGNSIKILVRYLWHAMKKHGLQVAAIDGGSLRNAIPRDASAHVVVPAGNTGDFEKCLRDFEKIVRGEFSFTEPQLKVTCEKAKKPAYLIDGTIQYRLINALYGCPNGVMRMSDAVEGLVETSTNLAVVKCGKEKISVQCLMRSSVDTAKEDLGNMIQSIFEPAGARVWFDGTYPGWKPNPDSPILKIMMEVYKNKFGKVPQFKALHAGLECGILGASYPNWDMISFGPTIRFPHSPDEKVNIKTVQKFWEYLVETLKHIPVKE